MAENGKKVFQIVINGIKESISQVDALMESLKALEKKIKELEDKKINISAAPIEMSGGIKDATVKAPTDTAKILDNLQAEDRVLRRIWQTERQIQETEEEQYQNLLKAKEELKERQQLAKETAAEERLLAGEYANSMAGMKQELANIKQAMNFHDLDDVDWFDKQIKRANELTEKLKSIEQSYGQYGRNVGNYASGVADGLKKAEQNSTSLKITIAGVTREFANARDASRTLGNELKSMAMAGKQNTKEYTELEKAFKRMQSTLKDIDKSSVAMDNMLDAAQSITAIMSVSQGFSTLFGIDNKELNESIQRLLALQTALNGLNTLMNQMKSGEFMGGLFNSIKNLFSSSKSSNLGDGGTSGLKESLESAAEGGAELTKSMDKSKKAIEGMGGATKAAGAGLKEMSEAGNTAAAGLGNTTTNAMGAVGSFEQLGTSMAKPQVAATLLSAELNKLEANLTVITTKILDLSLKISELETQKDLGVLNPAQIREADAMIKMYTEDIQALTKIQGELNAQKDQVIARFNRLTGEVQKEAAAQNEDAAATERNAKAHRDAVSATERAAGASERNAAATEKEAAAANAAAAANEKLAAAEEKTAAAGGKATTGAVGFGGKLKELGSSIFSVTGLLKFLGNTLKMIGTMAWWGVIIMGVTTIVGWLTKWVKGNADLIKSEDLVKNEIEQVNQKLKEQLELNKQLYAGKIGEKYKTMAEDEKAYGEALKETNKLLEEKIKLQGKNSEIKAQPLSASVVGDTGVTTSRSIKFGAIEDIKDFTDRYKELNDAVQKGEGLWAKYGLTASDCRDELAHLQQLVVGDLLNAMKGFDLSTREGAKGLQALIKENDKLTGGIYSTAIANMGNIVRNNGLKEALQEQKNAFTSFINFIEGNDAKLKDELQKRLKQARDNINKNNISYWAKEISGETDAFIEAYEKNIGKIGEEDRKTLEKDKNLRIKDKQKEINSRLQSEANKYKKLEKQHLKLEDEFRQLRVKAMEEGLKKELAEIEANKQKELDKWKGNAEAIRLVNIVYDREILNAKKKWAKDIRDVYQGLADDIYKIMADVNSRNLNISHSKTERTADENKDKSYETNIDLSNPHDIDNYRKYSEEVVKIETDTNNKLYQLEQQRIQNQYDAAVREENLRHKNVLDLEAQEKVIAEIQKRTKEDGSFIPEDDENAWAEFEKSLSEQLKNANGKLADAYNSGKISFKDFVTFTMQEQEAFNAKMDVLEKERQNTSEENVKKTNDRNYQSYADYYDRLFNTVKEKQDDINNELEKGEKASRNNPFQIINLAQYTKTLNTAKLQFTNLREELVQEKAKLEADLKAKKIKPEEFTIKNSELDKQIESIDNSLAEINVKSKDKIGEFVRDISQYVQAVGQGLQDILSAVWNAQDAEYDKRMEELDKFIDEYEDKLDKQEEITKEHANEVDRIEGALATARGDRRDALIDKLNAEMAAQRESLAQEKKMEKEKHKLEVKKEKEALEQKKREKQRAVIQAIVSTALAVTNGLATQPFMPLGIAMGALAAALGAVQIGIISSQKYAEGGVLEGKSHREGGIKVLGGRAEVEGGEFITNKYTTSKNVDLLDYINSKKRKLNIEDFIEFYSSGKVKKSVQAPRYAFAEGGQLPTLRNDISVGNTLTNALADYNNRPVVVQVKDIINGTDRVKKVQVMAGLEE